MKTDIAINKEYTILTEYGLLQLKSFINEHTYNSVHEKNLWGKIALAFLSVIDNTKYPIHKPKEAIITMKSNLDEVIYLFKNALERIVEKEWYEEATVIKESIVILELYKNKNKLYDTI